MGRCREVPPDQDRLYLAEVHKRAHDALVASGHATPEALEASEARVASAVEDNDYIDVKHRLNTGEARRAFTRMVKTMNAGEKATMDPEQVGRTKVLSYLLGWSFIGLNGKPIPYDVDMSEDDRSKSLDKLDVETYAEIEAAINWHEDAVDKESVARKKMKAGERASSKTPSSPSGSEDGVLATSAV